GLPRSLGVGCEPAKAKTGTSVSSVCLAGEVEEHGDILVILAPSPGFDDVIGVVEAEDQVMLVSRGRRFEVAGTLEVEAELFDIVGIGHHAHARLVVCGAVMDECGDSVVVAGKGADLMC